MHGTGGIKAVAATHFAELPNEVIKKIFSYLSPNELGNVRRVSKRFCDNVNKHVWATTLSVIGRNFTSKDIAIRRISPQVLREPVKRTLPSSDEITDHTLKEASEMVSGFYTVAKKIKLNSAELYEISESKAPDLASNGILIEILQKHPDQQWSPVVNASIKVLRRIQACGDQCTDLNTLASLIEILQKHPDQQWSPVVNASIKVLKRIQACGDQCTDLNTLASLIEILQKHPDQQWSPVVNASIKVLRRIQARGDQCTDLNTLASLIEILQKHPDQQWSPVVNASIEVLKRIQACGDQCTDLNTLASLIEILQKHPDQQWSPVVDAISVIKSANKKFQRTAFGSR